MCDCIKQPDNSGSDFSQVKVGDTVWRWSEEVKIVVKNDTNFRVEDLTNWYEINGCISGAPKNGQQIFHQKTERPIPPPKPKKRVTKEISLDPDVCLECAHLIDNHLPPHPINPRIVYEVEE